MISWEAHGIAKIGQHETAANNNDVSRPFPPVTRVHREEEKQEMYVRTVFTRGRRVHRERLEKRENDISLPGMVERTIPGKPRPALPEVGQKPSRSDAGCPDVPLSLTSGQRILPLWAFPLCDLCGLEGAQRLGVR